MILSGAYLVFSGSSHYGHRLAFPPAPAVFFQFPLSDQQPFIECPGLFFQPSLHYVWSRRHRRRPLFLT